METFDISTSHIMKYVHATYARSFNKKYDLTGHVFQGRYHAKIIENVKYELEVQKYIHMNPVEANVVKHPGDYKWSSYLAYSLGEDNPLVSTSHILSYFNEPQRENYDLFIQTANDELWLESMTNVKNIHRGERYVK
jgi:putative transposase